MERQATQWPKEKGQSTTQKTKDHGKDENIPRRSSCKHIAATDTESCISK